VAFVKTVVVTQTVKIPQSRYVILAVGSDTINQCYACRQNSNCPGTNVCKTDEAIADSQAALGACLKPTEIVYVNNAAGCSDTGTWHCRHAVLSVKCRS
jgi:hypothetical protein